jgi:TIR domain
MPHELFVSYSSRDQDKTENLCRALEAIGLPCWFARRDILPGQKFPESITRAIKQSRLFLLILSSESNSSPHVQRELVQADSFRIPMVVIRIEDVTPSEFLAYYIGSIQSLDATMSPPEISFPELATKIHSLLVGLRPARHEQRGSPREARGRSKKPRNRRSSNHHEPIVSAPATPHTLCTDVRHGPSHTDSFEELTNPYDFATVASPLTFKGRVSEIDELMDSVRDGTHTAIFGLQRMGKTSLVEEGLELRLRQEPELAKNVIISKIDFQRLGDQVKYGDFLREVVGRISDSLVTAGAGRSVAEIRVLTHELFRHTDPGDRSQLFSKFGKLLRGLSHNSGKHIILFIDEFSEVRKSIEQDKKTQINNPSRSRALPPHEMYVDQTFMRHLSALMRDHELHGAFTLVVAVRPFMAEYDERESLQILKLMKPIMLYHLDQAAAKALITEPVCANLDYQPGVIDSLCTMTAGHPYLLQFILKQLVDRVRREKRRLITNEDVSWIENRMITEGPAYDAQFSVVVSDYSVDEISMPQEKRLGMGTLALISKIGHEQKGGWVREGQIVEALTRHRIPPAKTASLLSQLLRARIVEESETAGDLHYRMTIPLLRKRFVRQNLYMKFFR